MAFTVTQYKKFVQAAITASLTTIYTTPASSQDVLKGIDVANTTASAISVTLHLVPSGGSASATTQLFPTMSIQANSLLHWTGTQVMNTGDFIQAIASATGASINISGLENT